MEENSTGFDNKRKGAQAEDLYADLVRLAGFDTCVASRVADPVIDKVGKIDLMGLPYNIQIKAGYNNGVNPSGLLSNMDIAIASLSLPSFPSVVIHHKNVPPEFDRTKYHSIVSMTFETFIGIVTEVRKLKHKKRKR